MSEPLTSSGDSHEAIVPAMGSVATVIVVGAPRSVLDDALARLADLEARWSRFLPDSEVSRHNLALADGRPTPAVSPETQLLFERAAEGHRISSGRFDPYRLAALTAAGYRRSLHPSHGPLAPQQGFDPGGIGKGLAADMVSAEIMAAGADGALVSVGGDLRVRGVAPEGGAWRIDIEDPRCDGIVTTVELTDGAVATSSQMKRRWTADDGVVRHHLIDPSTDTSSVSPVLSATVVSAEAWQAEVLTKVAFLDAFGDGALSTDAGLELIESLGAAALVVTPDLELSTSAWAHFDVGHGSAAHEEVAR
ncbi:MAG: FAD:protein FMN transferase [Acidimicrobiales bacterium]